jgi:hypothetical protein
MYLQLCLLLCLEPCVMACFETFFVFTISVHTVVLVKWSLVNFSVRFFIKIYHQNLLFKSTVQSMEVTASIWHTEFTYAKA